ncbi:xanthotoxin 5-hydroxylase CYP82C4-like [Nymphaea colorata]|uniref:xanthotoxin 5-hydroxylase CYP82C4-like n=1 Tax=Nymphaea colorata TaxID=210225 RepID=UPI00214E1B70|nr:xanthotoxin 5-hydroxylase CYP82C4-like [Nymphaea colorata]
MDSIKLVEGFAAFLALFFIYHIWPKKRQAETRHRPPQPGGAWPVVGHLGLLSGTTPLHRTLAALSEKHGALFTLQLGRMRVAVLSSADLAKECFITNDRAFAGRPPLQGSKCLGYDHAMFGLAPYGPYWREVRKMVTIKLLSNRRLELLKDIRVQEVGSLVRALYHTCGGDQPVDMKWRFSTFIVNIILRMVAGKLYVLDSEEGYTGDAGELWKVISEFFHLLGVLTVTDAIPWLEWLDVGGHLKAMKRVHKKMDRIASAWPAEHQRKKVSAGRIEAERDFIDVLIEELKDSRLSEKCQTDTIIKVTIMAVVSAGTDTISVTLEWTVAALRNNRQALEKAQQELDSNVGRERRVEESDIKNLPYLQAILKESMRLYPAAPLFLPHQSIEPIQLCFILMEM